MRPHQSALAASCWIAAAALYLVAEAVSASTFPGYSYATNYISDLGVPDVEVFQGRAIDSPLHLLMNTAFVLHGVLFVVAALAARNLAVGSPAPGRPAARWWFTVLAVAHGVGIVLVGLFHGSQASATTASWSCTSSGPLWRSSRATPRPSSPVSRCSGTHRSSATVAPGGWAS
jgi:hypothetical membrane protein